MERFGTGLGTHLGVRIGSVDSRGGSLRVEGPRGSPGRVGGPSERSKMGREKLGEVRDGSWDPRGGLGLVGELT